MIFAKGYSIKIAENRCLNQRHHGVECNHCIRNCPTGAIISSKNQVYLNKDKCNGCGLCLSDCPTQVFRSSQWDETTIIDDIEEGKWKITEFFCSKHSSPYKSDKNRDRGAVQIPACLSIVSKGAWYELGLKTEIELHFDQCEGCPLSNALTRLKFNVSIAIEWLEASGHTPKFSYVQKSSQGKTKRSLEAINTGLKVTSRRDLFLSIFNKGRQITGQLPDQVKSFPENINQELRNSFMPDWQRRLAEVYPGNMIEGSPPAYWPTLKMNSNCVNCGMCSSFCPSGTLQIVVKNGICTHYFTSGLCLDCRICQLICPREAISRDREQVEKPFETIIIYTSPVIKCQRCESVTYDNSTHLCYWCSKETTSDDELIETCKKLFLKMES